MSIHNTNILIVFFTTIDTYAIMKENSLCRCVMFKGDRLKLLREEKKITQMELGKFFGISDAAINYYEKNKRQPDTELIAKIAEYFNVSTDYLLGLTDYRTPVDKISEALGTDQELLKFWEETKDRENVQLLFKQIRHLSDKDINQVIRIIKAIEDEEANE